MRIQSLIVVLFTGFFLTTFSAQACERFSVCEFDEILTTSEHEWQLPVHSVLSYRSAFSESEKQVAAFMLCNAPGRPSCEDADAMLSDWLANGTCQEIYFVSLVDGQSIATALFGKTFEVVFAFKLNRKTIKSVQFPVVLNDCRTD